MEWDLEDLKQSIIQSAIDHYKIMDDTFIQTLKAKKARKLTLITWGL